MNHQKCSRKWTINVILGKEPEFRAPNQKSLCEIMRYISEDRALISFIYSCQCTTSDARPKQKCPRLSIPFLPPLSLSLNMGGVVNYHLFQSVVHCTTSLLKSVKLRGKETGNGLNLACLQLLLNRIKGGGHLILSSLSYTDMMNHFLSWKSNRKI